MRLHRLVISLLLLLLVAVAGCAPKLPSWSSGVARDYPDAEYLVGVGVGPDRLTAEDRARGAIAKIFEVRLRSAESSSESFWSARIGEASRSEYQQDVSSTLVATTNRVLKGVRIAEVWQQKGADVHALAVLDRLQAARPLRQSLEELDLRVAALVQQGERERATLLRLGRYLEALAALREREALASDLAILLPGGYVTAAPYRRAEIAARIDETAAKVRLGLELEGDRDGIVKGALIGALAGLGIRLAPSYEQDVVIRGTVTSEAYQAGGPWHWTTASAQVLFLLPDGSPLDSLRLGVREGSQVAGQSQVRAFERLGEDLSTALVDALVRQGLGARGQ